MPLGAIQRGLRLDDDAAWKECLLCREAGPSVLPDNAQCEVRLLDIDGIAVPLVIANQKADQSSICTPSSHYARYPASESIKRNRTALRPAIRWAFACYGGVLRWEQIDKVVYINNWLLTTNPVLSLSVQQYRRLIEWLKVRFPGRAIVHRTANPYLNPGHFKALCTAGFKMVRSRVVYIIDPASPQFKCRTNIRKIAGYSGALTTEQMSSRVMMRMS